MKNPSPRPLAAAERSFDTAYSFRRHLQKTLLPFLGELPREKPFAGRRMRSLPALPEEIEARWPPAREALLEHAPSALLALPIDHSVAPVAARGGPAAARTALTTFLDERFDSYGERRNAPGADATSGLSPYLHFGHLSVHEVFRRIAAREEWSPLRVAARASGSREGWWGMRPSAEGFLDQIVTWRELGYNFCARHADHDQYESLPAWVRKSLDTHAQDARPHVYTPDQLACGATHDPLWNAAQTQLNREGRIHNYLRMLWGKKILEWSPSPQAALETMIELNNRLALDGRNPNSYTGISWTFGRFDRPWAPERPIFGRVRYMSSENTARKFDVKDYLRQYLGEAAPKSKSRRLLR